MANVNPAAISAKVAAAAAGRAASAAGRTAVAASQPPQAAAAPKQKKPPALKAEKTLPENPQVLKFVKPYCLHHPFADEAPRTAAERDVRSAGVRTDRTDRGASQLHLHDGRHGERDDLLGAGQEQEGGKEGSCHLGRC